MTKPTPPGVSRPAAPLSRGCDGRRLSPFRFRCLRAAQQVVPQQGHDKGATRGGARPSVPMSKEGAPRGLHYVPLLVRQNVTIRDPVSAYLTQVHNGGPIGAPHGG